MRRYIQLTIATILIAVLSFTAVIAQCQNNKVIIAGRVDASVIKKFKSKELLVVINNTTNQESRGIIQTVPLTENGDFKTSILSTDTLIYLSFEMVHEDNHNMPLNINYASQRLLKEVYLFQKGDSIRMNVQNNGTIKFQGRGSEKLNCQSRIYSIEPMPKSLKSRENELLKMGKLKNMLLFRDRIINISIQLQLEILNSFANQFSDYIYNLLYLDILASSKYEILQPLISNFYLSKESSTASDIQKYYQFYLQNENPASIDPAFFSTSAYHADMIFEKELNSFKLYKNEKLNRDYSFQEVYSHLKRSYTGKLRDKLLMICFERLGKHFFTEARSLVNDALGTIEDPKYISLFTEWKNNQYTAFPFELTDAKDQTHRLSDYRGKLLVIDFWYTGCVWCSVLNASMHSVVNRYKGNNSIVFLTVCLDKQKDQWLKSVAGGKYTSPGTIDLFTMGLGIKHPLVAYYNFQSFPQQLIIGKDGTLLTSHPPRVDESPENMRKFLNIIDIDLYQ